MASLPPWVSPGPALEVGGLGVAHPDAVTHPGVYLPCRHGFDLAKRVTFHPETQYIERTERRQ